MLSHPTTSSIGKDHTQAVLVSQKSLVLGGSWHPLHGSPPEDGMHVWALKIRPEAADSDWAILSEKERDKAKRFVYPIDRNDWVQARAFWRKVLGKHLKCSPESIAVETSQRGAHSVQPFIYQTLSHTRGLVLMAVSSMAQVGVDVEHVREINPQSVADITFTVREKELLLQSNDKERDFFRLWTKKEAWSKALGMGLHLPFDTLEVSLEKQFQIMKSLEPFPEIKEWQFLEIDVGASHIASLAYSSPPAKIYYWLFNP